MGARTTFVVLLRGVNVGGRRLAMADLRVLVSDLGYEGVATYVQSGNLVCTGPGPADRLARAVAEGLDARLGLTVPVVVRTADRFGAVAAGNPLADRTDDPTKLHVTFLGGRPDPAAVAALADAADRYGDDRYGDDRYEVVGEEVYLHCPGAYHETVLSNAYLERTLGVTATTRNWRTVGVLAGMVGGVGVDPTDG